MFTERQTDIQIDTFKLIYSNINAKDLYVCRETIRHLDRYNKVNIVI